MGRRGSSPFSRHPTDVPSGAGRGALEAFRRRRGCERRAPRCSRQLSRLLSHPPPLPRSAALFNPRSRPASRLALNNCLPPAKRPWGKYLLNGNSCPGSRGEQRLFQAYWVLAPALVNKPARKSHRQAAPYPPPARFRERLGREERSLEGAGRGGCGPSPSRLPPYPPSGRSRCSTSNFASFSARSRLRHCPLRSEAPLSVGNYLPLSFK